MLGTLLNVSGIVIGGLIGLTRKKPLSPALEAFFKVTIGAFTVFYGLRLTWTSVSGSFLHILKQLLIVVVALTLGNLLGKLMRLQKLSNQLGQTAREQLAVATTGKSRSAADGFKICAILFCAAPLGILGAAQDGLSRYFYPLAVKGVVDGLATMGFVPVFGWGPLLSALPVLAFQGTITLLCSQLSGQFLAPAVIESVNAVGGLLVFCVGMIVLDLKKIGLADYLPSLLFAPVIARLAGW